MITKTALTEQLSESETTLARNIIACGGDFDLGATASGYAKGGLAALKSRVTRKPAFLAAIHIETQRSLQLAAPVAQQFIVDLVRNADAPAKLRLDAAKTLLDRAGHIAPRARALGEGQDKTLGEMTLDELKETQERLQAELASRAKPVNAQEAEATDTQAIDLVG